MSPNQAQAVTAETLKRDFSPRTRHRNVEKCGTPNAVQNASPNADSPSPKRQVTRDQVQHWISLAPGQSPGVDVPVHDDVDWQKPFFPLAVHDP
jgi:hypothetical protein